VSNVRRSWITVSLAILLTLVARSARADRVDDLCRSLTTDPSWRVRLQAAVVLGKVHDARSVPSLLRALGDENETVRGLSAQVLGDLGDSTVVAALQRAHASDSSAFVRDKAGNAVARLQAAQAARSAPSAHAASKMHVEIGGIGVKPRHVPPELAVRLREFIIRELEKTPGVTLDGQPVSGFLIDSSITEVSRRTTEEFVEITCEISMIVGRLPSRSMIMMTSGGATVQAPKLGLRPEREKALQIDALEGAVEGAHQNLLSFLKTQQKM
jgi:HEAT repeat protein